MSLKTRCQPFARYVQAAKAEGYYPYFRPLAQSWGTEVEVNGRRLVMIGSNDYLGFSHEPRVMEAAVKAMRHWGTGAGGSRFLCGNLVMHELLEERLAAFVNKKKAVVHVTGFSTNLGAIACLLTPHNNVEAAAQKLADIRQKNPHGLILLITEGVFSMSGDLSPLPELVQLKKEFPDLLIYLDDAHGLGVMGPNGRGTVAHFGVTKQVDFIMGTFSKALASVGGFIAADDEDVLEFLRHHSRPLIFSAALPASNAATVLGCLEVLEKEPERVARLWEITNRVHAGYREIGLITGDSKTPIIPIHIGDDQKAFAFARDLFEHGVFALPAIFPAVPRGQAVIRTAYMSTHEDRQIDFVLEVLSRLAKKHQVRAEDLTGREQFLSRGDFPSQSLRI
jgi:glycine C-acetyltransferase